MGNGCSTLGFWQSKGSVALFPLATLLKQVNTLEPLKDISLCSNFAAGFKA
jgi:hypothetical protein